MRLLALALLLPLLFYPAAVSHSINDLTRAFDGAKVKLEGSMSIFGINMSFIAIFEYHGFNETDQPGYYNLTFYTAFRDNVTNSRENETEYYVRDFNETPFIVSSNDTDISIPFYDHLRHDEAVNRLVSDIQESLETPPTVKDSTRKVGSNEYSVTIIEAHSGKGDAKIVLARNVGLILYAYLNDSILFYEAEVTETNVTEGGEGGGISKTTLIGIAVIAIVIIAAIIFLLRRQGA